MQKTCMGSCDCSFGVEHFAKNPEAFQLFFRARCDAESLGDLCTAGSLPLPVGEEEEEEEEEGQLPSPPPPWSQVAMSSAADVE